MIGGDDSFLARWSRRKREVEVAEGAASTPPVDSAAAESPADTAFAASFPARSAHSTEPDGDPASALADAGPAADPLPDVDTLTADSDLSAFFRKGVPEALKAAALRRMWSLDPAIRDHVGPAEYAWDFNQPTSIPGFGPPPAALGNPVSYATASRPLESVLAPAETAAPDPALPSAPQPETASLHAKPIQPLETAQSDPPSPTDAQEQPPPAGTAREPAGPRPGAGPGATAVPVRHGGARPR